MDFAILKALVFVASLLDGIYLGVIAHELGHALVALTLTSQNVRIKVGTSAALLNFNINRLSISLGLAGFRYGATSYDRSQEPIATQRYVILGGPIASLVLTIAFGASLWQFEPWSWLWVILFGFFVANFRILIVSIWPMQYKAPDGSGDVWLSDSLDFWRMGKRMPK